MSLVDPRVPERLEVGARAYFLKPPTTTERVKWRRSVAAAGGRKHNQMQLLAAMQDGVTALMADDHPDVRQAVLDKIEKHRANIMDVGTAAAAGTYDDIATKPDDVRAELGAGLQRISDSGKALATIEAAVLDGYPRYAAMISDNQVYGEVAGLEGARLFLVDWEGFEGKPERTTGGLVEASLAAIPEGDLAAIAEKVEQLTRVSDAKRKNSSSSPQSSSGGETLTT